MCVFGLNRFREDQPSFPDAIDAIFAASDIPLVHQSLPAYQPTPLVACPHLARQLGIGRLLVKDESQRFGLSAFKALGAAHAVYKFICAEREREGRALPDPAQFYRDSDIIERDRYTFCTATDGNHGRGVAWIARQLHQRAVIFMPHGSANARVEAIEGEGSDVIIVAGSYDDAVRAAREAADLNGWQLISDTSWTGYTTIPTWIMAGYTTLFREIDEAMDEPPDAVFVQAGVGALGAAAGWYYTRVSAQRPRLVSVESTHAACCLESINSLDGELTVAGGDGHTIMVGLNCATPSLVAWPIMRATFDLFIAIGDNHCRTAMHTFAKPEGGDPLIESGESGAAGLAALLALDAGDALSEARDALQLSAASTVLVINTEGLTGGPLNH